MKSVAGTLILLLGLSASASAQDGGKLPWKGKGGNPQAAMAEAHQQGRPMLLFFTSKGCKFCSEISAGAFSDPKVVEAADRLQCVFIDCDWGKKNTDLSDAYKVKGYPTVVFCGPDAKPIDSLPATDPATVAKKINEIADKFGSKPVFDVPTPKLEGMSYPAALAESRRLRKPIAYFFYDDTPGSQNVTTALTDAGVQRALKRFVLAITAYKKDSPEALKFGVSRAPVILILDGSLAKPEEKPIATIVGSKSPRELVRELEAVLPAAADPGTSSRPPGGTPAPREPEEKLSDDELERKFIQARIGIALETLKKGQKDKAIGILEDVLQSYPKHVETQAVKKLLEDMKK